MRLYNSIGPNPGVVRMFMQEKGIELLVAWHARVKARPGARA